MVSRALYVQFCRKMGHAGEELFLGNLVTKSYGRKAGSGW